jgi:O-antigen/teichoic acid export membrane protein
LQPKKLRRNVLAAFAQTAFVAICLFLTYRIVAQSVGMDMLGLWSLLMSVTWVLRTADVSGGSALARFLALPSDKRPGELAPLLSTILIFSVGINVVLAVIFAVAMALFLPFFVPKELVRVSEQLLPYATILMFLSSSSVSVTAALDGLQRADQRALVQILAAAVCLLATWLLIPYYETIGFAVAQILQQLIVLILSWFLLSRKIPDLGCFPRYFDLRILRQTMPYTLMLNASGVVSSFFEPLAKFALNHTGGLELVGHFELANRLCLQLRGFAVSSATPLVPEFASYSEKDDPRLSQTISRVNRVFGFLGIAMVLAAAIGGPAMSELVLGRFDRELILLTAVLAWGWSINMLSVPMYFAAQGQGKLRWNIFTHLWLALCVALGLVIPAFTQVPSVVWGIVFGLVTGSGLNVAGNAVSLGIASSVREDVTWLLAVFAVTACISIAQLFALHWFLL